MSGKYRIEHDSMGELQVPAEALWGAQTQRAVENFPVSGQRMPRAFIRALGLIKASAAEVNTGLGLLPKGVGRAIRAAALDVAAGGHDAHFPIDVYQTGSGTSSNMNANEVIAMLANQGGKAGKTRVHPNDHVNLGQSSNDVIPTAIRVSAQLQTVETLLPALRHLRRTIDRRGRALGKVVKTGRTHLMDAMPLTFAQEFGAWSAQLESAQGRIEDALKRLRRLPLGGTAIGTGINADPRFGGNVARALSAATGTRFESAQNKFEGLAAQDDAVELSGQFNALAVALIKIANDLRWMNSGPLAGLGEVELPALQPGSSIMPGKVNPVIPEVMNQVAFEVIGNDITVTMASEAGQLQLNAFEPIMGWSLFKSIQHLSRACNTLQKNCVEGIEANREFLAKRVRESVTLVTALNPLIGYEKAALIAKTALATGGPIDLVAESLGIMTRAEMEALLVPEHLTQPVRLSTPVSPAAVPAGMEAANQLPSAP